MTLEFPENKVTASRYVREAIPKMVKNSIVPNPSNFALWYTYVSNRDLDLNLELDDALAKQGTCPENIASQLFKKYVIKDEIDWQQSLQDSLGNILHDVNYDVQKTHHDTSAFTENLANGLESLHSDENDVEHINGVVKKLIASAASTSKIVANFGEQLTLAEQEIAALKVQIEEKENDAFIDALTLVGNRRAFNQRIYAICETEKSPATLILIDIDHFKKLNDTYGHLLGDKVLQGVGKILNKLCPEGALAARYGGEEFAYLIDAPASLGCALAEQTRQMLLRLSLRQKNNDQAIDNVSASFGVAERLPGEHVEQLIERADRALYRAKTSGRNRVEQAD